MKVSLLGSNGFLATAIAKYCNSKGWPLDVYGRRIPLHHEYNSFYEVDFMKDALDCKNLLDSDVIIYALGAGIQSSKDEDSKHIYDLNVYVPVTICNNLNDLHYDGTFISFGSYFEIGESNVRRPFNEEDVLNSVFLAPNDYVVSKRLLSRFVTSYKPIFKHWHFCLPTIYGERENSGRLIPYTINAIRRGLSVHFTSGYQVRQYIHVSEIPIIIEKAFINNLPSGFYNIQGNETLTIKELVEVIYSTFGKIVPVDCFGKLERVDVSMQYLELNGNKLRSQIQYNPSIRIIDVIKQY